MTREEAIGNLLRHLRYTVDSTDALIKALDQETCEDVISRQAVIERLKKEDKILYTTTGLNYLIRAIEELPSVNPQKNIVNNGTMNITL